MIVADTKTIFPSIRESSMSEGVLLKTKEMKPNKQIRTNNLTKDLPSSHDSTLSEGGREKKWTGEKWRKEEKSNIQKKYLKTTKEARSTLEYV